MTSCAPPADAVAGDAVCEAEFAVGAGFLAGLPVLQDEDAISAMATMAARASDAKVGRRSWDPMSPGLIDLPWRRGSRHHQGPLPRVQRCVTDVTERSQDTDGGPANTTGGG
jgi:hypothetical protein